MPATSKRQQRFFGLVHAVQQGKIKAPSAHVQKVADEMSEDDVNDYAKTKHTKLSSTIQEALEKTAALDDATLQGLGGKPGSPLDPKLELSGVDQGIKRFLDGLKERAAKTGTSPLDFADQQAIARFAQKVQQQKAFAQAAAGGMPKAPLFPQQKVAYLLTKLGK